jgi:hypothetical protein
MMVLDIYKCRICENTCNSIHFQHNFNSWTSGNNDIDKFIQSIQLSTHKSVTDALEWIPYDRFYDIKYIAESKFEKVYKANWIDGCINEWDNGNQNWRRADQNMIVILKNLNNPASITSEFINEV